MRLADARYGGRVLTTIALLALMATSEAAFAGATTTATSAMGSVEQSIRIDIRGAVAHVTVNRRLACATASQSVAGPSDAASHDNKDTPRDTILDVALPDRSALLNVELDDGSGFAATKPLAANKARDAYVESLRAVGFVAAEAPFEEEVRFRIRVACRKGNHNNNVLLRYSFSVLLELSANRAHVAFPAAPEASAPRTRVEVHLDPPAVGGEIVIGGVPHPILAGSTSVVVDFVSQRTRWTVSFGPVSERLEGFQPGRTTHLAALASVGTPASGPTILAYSIGARPGPRQQLPTRVLFLLDRSRSVGASGLEAERNLARGILDAMPPSTRFDAVFFDREQKRLFPVARPATQDAIRALEEQMIPSLLANGTDLGAALRATGDLIRRETSDFSPSVLLILVSDGAIGAPAGGAHLAAFLGSLPGVDLLTAAISVRVNDDPEVSPDERSILRRLAAAASGGGIERTVRVREIPDAIPAILEALRAGGDVYSVEIAPRGLSAGAATGQVASTDAGVVEVVSPGEGATGILALPPHQSVPSRAMLTYRGLRRPSKLRLIPVDPRWLTPLLHGVSAETRLMVGPALAVLVEPVVRSTGPEAAAPPEPRGYLERSVVRDALSLAFTPRARACYLNRTARTRAERDLTGRVRLALDLVRGEVVGARIVASTLGHLFIENCLRESAYRLEVPRAYRNDDPVTAVLNLVFRPRTPERRNPDAENISLGHELDVIIEAALKGTVGQEKPFPEDGPSVKREPDLLER
jgi:von Willebrand factor type A domain